jgi:hypothetical protein
MQWGHVPSLFLHLWMWQFQMMFLSYHQDSESSLLIAALFRETGAVMMNSNLRSVLTIAFQFAYEAHTREACASMARRYVRTVVASVQRVAMALAPSHLPANLGGTQLPPGSPDTVILAHRILQSYRYQILPIPLLLLISVCISNLQQEGFAGSQPEWFKSVQASDGDYVVSFTSFYPMLTHYFLFTYRKKNQLLLETAVDDDFSIVCLSNEL